ALNPYCPADPTDPDNNNVIVDGVPVPYGSDASSAADNGLGHAFVMTVDGIERIYHLNRANSHIDQDQLVVHTLTSQGSHPVAGLPDFGYVSPLGSGGYPALDASARMTSGLMNPDAIFGAADINGTMTIIYVSKQLNTAEVLPPAGDKCASTPA